MDGNSSAARTPWSSSLLPPLPPPSAKIIQAEAKEVLNENDTSALCTFIFKLYSTSPDIQSLAKTLLNYLKNYYLKSLCLRLLYLLSSPIDIQLKHAALDLLSRLLTRAEHDLWHKLAIIHRNELKPMIINLLKKERSRSFLLKLLDFVSDIASVNVLGNDWPELLDFLFESLDSELETIVEGGLVLLAQLVQGRLAETLLPRMDKLHEILTKMLDSDVCLQVKIAAVKASVNFVLCWTTPSNQDLYQDLLVLTMKTFFLISTEGKFDFAVVVLEELILLAREKLGFFSLQIDSVIQCMLTTAENSDFGEKMNLLAMEFILTIAEETLKGRPMLLNFPQHIKRFLSIIIMKLSFIIKDAPSRYDAESDEQNDEQRRVYSQEIEILVRIANALGGKATLVSYSDEFRSFLDNTEWQNRHAAITSLAVITQSCSKELRGNLGGLLRPVVGVIRDVHPLVRCAAMKAIAEFSMHLSPEVQEQCHQQVLPALTTALGDIQNPCVQMQAALAIFFFCKNCTSEVLTPYLNGIVSKLLGCLQKGKQMLKVRALSALAIIAYASKDHFQEYYETVMPILKFIMWSATDTFNEVLLAASIECITTIGVAVGKEKFRDEIDGIVRVLISAQGAPMEPMRRPVLQAWGRLCKCLGKEFEPFLTFAIPPLLQSAQLRCYVTIAKDYDDIEASGKKRIKLISRGQKKIGIKTDILEEKATACEVLCCCADELKEYFGLWTEEVAHTLVPLLKFELHENIRRAAILAMPALLYSSKTAMEKGPQNICKSPLEQLSAFIIPKLVEALHDEGMKELHVRILDSLRNCIQIPGPILNETQVGKFIDEIIAVLMGSSFEESFGMKLSGIKDINAEDQKLLEDEMELLENAINCLTAFIRIYKAFLPSFFGKILSCTELVWDRERTAKDRRLALRIFLDIMKQCPEETLKYYETNLPPLIKACYNEHPKIQKVGAQGICSFAEFGAAVLKPLIKEALSGLNAVIRNLDASEKDNALAHDVAISALGKIYQFHRDSVDAVEIISMWLSHLPIKHDEHVAQVVHDQLCSMVEKSDELLLGKDKANLPKIIAVYDQILKPGNNLATEETKSRMIKQLKHLQETLPSTTWAFILTSLQPPQRSSLQDILSS